MTRKLRVGDRVKIRPVATVINRDMHNQSGVVNKTLDIRSALWNIGVNLGDPFNGVAYFDESELEFLGENIYEQPKAEPVIEPEVQEALTDDAILTLLLKDATDSRLDMAIEFLEGRVNVYHTMFHRLENDVDERLSQVYALVHDEALIALRLLQQYKDEDGVLDAE